MLTFPRSLVRSLRAVSRKCVVGRPRGPAPPVLVIPESNAVSWVIYFEEVVLTYRLHGQQARMSPMSIAMEVLDALNGPGDEIITLDRVDDQRGELRWSDRGELRNRSVELQLPDLEWQLPPLPKRFSTMPAEFALALHEAGRTTGRTPNRFAFNRVQLKGDTGDLIATDSFALYWHSGFTFPFADNLLIPSIPVFALPEFAKEIRLGRTEKHLVAQVGAWTLFLLIDTEGRFPDVEGVVPKSFTPTILTLGEEDAQTIIERLPELPGSDEENQPITLDLAPGQPVVIRARDQQSQSEVVLTRSAVTNESVRVAINRTYLKRAIQLGCRTFRVVSSNKPVVASHDKLSFVIASLDSINIVEADATSTNSPSSTALRSPLMKPVERNGHTPERSELPEVGDPLAEAEKLRALLMEATQSVGRLVALLKSRKKEQKALATVYSSLKSLNLSP